MKSALIGLFTFFIVATSGACEQGDAKVGEGKNGKTLLICAPHSLLPGNTFKSIQGRQLFHFFKANENDAAFRKTAADTIGLSYAELLKALEKDYAEIEVYSDDAKGLQLIADRYRTWSGASNRVTENDALSRGETLPSNQLLELVAANKTAIQRTQNRTCTGLASSNANIVAFKFDDGEVTNGLPVDIYPVPGKANRYRLTYIPAYMNLTMYYGQEAVQREITIEPNGAIRWAAPNGSSYTISSKEGLTKYANFPTARGKINSACELQQVAKAIRYGDSNGDAENSRSR